MNAPTYLDAGGLRFPLAYHATGPFIEHGTPFEPLAWVIAHFLQGKMPGLLEAVRANRDVTRAEMRAWRYFYASPAKPSEIESTELAVWNEVSGGRPLDEPMAVGSQMTYRSFVMPRAVLIEVLEKFAVLKAEWAKYTPPPYAPPTPAPPAPTPLPPKRLFRPDAIDGDPTERERLALVDTERRAIALDEAASAATTLEQRESVAVQRRIVLDDLDAYGLLDAARVTDKRTHLARWKLPTLVAYLDAAVALRAYLASRTRATYRVPPPPAHVLEANVSLDWFRNQVPTPADATADGWLAFCEQVLVDSRTASAAGVIYSKLGQRRYEIRHRVEARSQPVVFSASELR